MKKSFSLSLFLSMYLVAFAQLKAPDSDPVIGIKNAPRSPQSDFAYQPKDFNYTFYPSGQYNRYARVHRLDTVTQNVNIIPDSTINQKIQVVVEKSGDLLVVRGVSDPTAVHYRESVKFSGFTNDGTQTMVYTANTKDTEVIYVNPTLGYVVIGFKTCDSRYTKDCDLNYHYFGIVPARKFMK